MQKLYLDCDGVILDTINKSYVMIKEKGLTTGEEVNNFYKNINWDDLIRDSGEINNSIAKIEILKSYFDVSIFTHVISGKEASSKIKYFEKVLPNVEVLIVPKRIEKADLINPYGTILVDDFVPNLDKWEEKGGIGIKFSDSGKKSQYITISDLLELTKINFKNIVKERKR